MKNETPVFDRASELPTIVESKGDWSPPRVRMTVPGVRITVGAEGPDIGWRLAAQAARMTSRPYSGQAANDNQDWPLGKLLKTENLDYHFALAERYRDLANIADMPCQLRGTEATDLYIVQNTDGDGRNKGTKIVKGAAAETAPTRSAATTDQTKKRAAPVPRKWNGDWPLLAKIDAGREIAILRGRLAYVPKILDAFEWAVVDGLTLTEIGQRLGAGSKGGKGEARARIFDGFDIVDRWWGQKRAA